ncbi:RNA polymerase factor sigma-54 [Acidimangrovimonas pyrenivorans]|uniref:RNA polymerase sigma-54 factor n=1 Tax=Acidimangrovimonas pyrenivorans TaxID=2030798 RepID=A0ABV7AKH7_9RHOB
MPAATAPSALRRSSHLLRLPAAALQRELAGAAAANPALQYRPPPAAPATYRPAPEGRTLTDGGAVAADLRRALNTRPLAAAVRRAALHLAGALRPDGYLATTLEAAAHQTGLPVDTVAAGLRALQGCGPAGIGARDLAECLALQLADRDVAPPLAAQVVARLELFAREDWPALARELGQSTDEIRALAAKLRGLTPQPLAAAPAPAVPDLTVSRAPDGTLSVHLSPEAAPELTLDSDWLAKADPADPRTAEARGRAEALIRALRNRGTALLRIGSRLVQDQRDFFLHGPDHLTPLSRRRLAGELGLHPSTLGRAVAGKALAIDGLLYPLSLFFPSALHGSDGRDVSSFAVKRAIRRMIGRERPERPLSDAAICDRLHADGVDITRRCVAKYRSCMGIPPSFKRRRREVSPDAR